MNKILLTFILAISIVNMAFSQEKLKKTLLTIKGDEVSISDFISAYEKNLDVLKGTKYEDVKEYLQLYIEYKSKLIQARELGLDTLEAYKKEISLYRKDLVKPYFNDPKEEEKLLEEIFERSKKELNISLALIPFLDVSDTLKDYTRALEFMANMDEGNIPEEYSEIDSGWVSVFDTPYSLETVAYSLPLGGVSKPIRSANGYYIIRLNEERKSKGRSNITYITIGVSIGEDAMVSSKEVIDSIYEQLNIGANFFELADGYSEDISPIGSEYVFNSKLNGEIYNLKIGEFTKPFENVGGWYIVKLLERYPIASKKSNFLLKEELFNDDVRASKMQEALAKRLSSKYSIEMYENVFEEIESNIDSTSFYKPDWRYKRAIAEKNILTVEGEGVRVEEYIRYLENNPVNKKPGVTFNDVLREKRNEFVQNQALKYYGTTLEDKFPEFRDVMNNYREGILIFNLMNFKIWEHSKFDEKGMKMFYENNKEKYMWGDRADITLLIVSEKEKAEEVLEYLNKGKTGGYILSKLNENLDKPVIYKDILVEENNNILPDDFVLKKENTIMYKKEGGNYVVIKVNRMIPPQQKTMDEARYMMISDYHEYLEDKWREDLKQNYKAVLNSTAFEELKKKYSNK